MKKLTKKISSWSLDRWNPSGVPVEVDYSAVEEGLSAIIFDNQELNVVAFEKQDNYGHDKPCLLVYADSGHSAHYEYEQI